MRAIVDHQNIDFRQTGLYFPQYTADIILFIKCRHDDQRVRYAVMPLWTKFLPQESDLR